MLNDTDYPIRLTPRSAHDWLLKPQCIECERIFDLSDDEDQEEWTYGHDCEVEA